MNPQLRRILGFGLALYLAALAQSVCANGMEFHGARPDFLVTVALLGALFCDTNGGAALGFFAGVFHACLASPPSGGFGSLIVSRTLVCLGVGWLEERLFRDNALIAVLTVLVGTALAEGFFFLFDPQHNILHWARAVGLTAIYNAFLALPLYFLLRWLIGVRPERRRL